MQIDSILRANVKGKCELIKNENLSIDAKRIIAKHIKSQWVAMTHDERHTIYDVCLWLLKQGMVNVCDTISQLVIISDNYKSYPLLVMKFELFK